MLTNPGLVVLVSTAAASLYLGAATAFPDLQIGGIVDDPEHVLPGDMFCCVERITRSSVWDGHEPEAVQAALTAGAVAILADKGTEFPEGLVPDTVPVILADEVDELAARLAAVLFGELSPAQSPLDLWACFCTEPQAIRTWQPRWQTQQLEPCHPVLFGC